VLDADDVAPATELEPGQRKRTAEVGIVFSGLGLLLAVAFLPMLFNSVAAYDDEGYFLVAVSQFLHHGSLYVHTLGTSYGPFYWSFIGLIYRLTGQNPTLTVGACWCWRSRRCRLEFSRRLCGA
jgi:hypothetical protein